MDEPKTNEAKFTPPEQPRTADCQAEWIKMQDLVAASSRLAAHEPKMAATALGKAYEAAKAWSKLVDPKLVDPKGED